MAMPLLLLASGEPAPITAVAGEPVCEFRIRLAEAMGVEAEFVELAVGEAVLEDEQLWTNCLSLWTMSKFW